MSQRCPVCKTWLWTEPLTVRSRMECPRCGAEFKATVPWFYVRILLIFLVFLALALIFVVSHGDLPLLTLLVIVGLLLWFAPRLIQFDPIGPKLTPSEGLLESRQWKTRSEERNLDDKLTKALERLRFRWAVSVIVIVGLLLTLTGWLYQSL